MPRRARKNLSTSFFHVITQGINKEYIFNKESYKRKYLKIVKEAKEQYEIDIVAYAIMSNHCHFLIYTENINNLSNFMKKVNEDYARYYNYMENRVGYVFRDRIKSILIMTREQLYVCIKYIHMNPVKAKIVEKESEYKYSSYNDYLNKTGFLNQRILEFLFHKSQNYIEKFKSIPYKDICNKKINIEEILNKFLKQKNISLNQIKKETKFLSEFLYYLNSKNYQYSKQELANILRIGRATLYRKIKKVKTRNETKNLRP